MGHTSKKNLTAEDYKAMKVAIAACKDILAKVKGLDAVAVVFGWYGDESNKVAGAFDAREPYPVNKVVSSMLDNTQCLLQSQVTVLQWELAGLSEILEVSACMDTECSSDLAEAIYDEETHAGNWERAIKDPKVKALKKKVVTEAVAKRAKVDKGRRLTAAAKRKQAKKTAKKTKKQSGKKKSKRRSRR